MDGTFGCARVNDRPDDETDEPGRVEWGRPGLPLCTLLGAALGGGQLGDPTGKQVTVPPAHYMHVASYAD